MENRIQDERLVSSTSSYSLIHRRTSERDSLIPFASIPQPSDIISCDVGLRIKDAGQRYLFPFKWQPNRRQLPVLVFVPSSSLALGTLGGTSHIYEFASDQSYWNHINPYPPKSAHRRLQDFLTDRRLYVLCERKGESVCEVAYFGPGVERRTWTPAVCGLTDELHRKLSVGCCYNQAR